MLGPFQDLRSFIQASEDIGEVKVIEHADWDQEIGALTETVSELIQEPPMLIFDRIKGYPDGYRVACLPIASFKRSALAFGLPKDLPKMQLIRAAVNKMREAKPIPPVEVHTGPVMENVQTGDDVDLLQFPTPWFHAKDGGRYIGTADTVINRDPESGYVNTGTYRIQVHAKNVLGLWMSPGQQGRLICERYWKQGKSCPIAVTFGGDLLTFMTSNTKFPWGVSELDIVGGLHGKAMEVVKGPYTGLPIPAHAEIAIEGEVPPPDVEARDEGPFGEWPGYYSAGTIGTGEPQPVIKVKALYYRNDPILLAQAPQWPGAPIRALRLEAGVLWDQLEKAGIQDVVGVYDYNHYLVVIAIKQRYAGHAKQVGMAALGCSALARNGRYVVIVDEDIDPSNIQEVLWAMETRVDPATDIQIVDGCWSTPLDPRMPPDKRLSGDFTNSRAIYYAVRPYAWKDRFPLVSRTSPDMRRQMVEKYKSVFHFPNL